MRSLLIALVAFALSSCGFKPLYATPSGGNAGGALAEVALGDVRGPDDARDLMRTTLKQRLPDPGGEQRYLVSVDLRERTQAVSVTIDSNARRFNYTLTGRVLYVDQSTGTRRTQNLQSVASFAVVPSQYASLVAREDAVRRAVIDLAQKIEIDAAFYAEGAAPDASNESLFIGTDNNDPLRRLENDAERERRAEEAQEALDTEEALEESDAP